jgi:hypothetical protein
MAHYLLNQLNERTDVGDVSSARAPPSSSDLCNRKTPSQNPVAEIKVVHRTPYVSHRKRRKVDIVNFGVFSTEHKTDELFNINSCCVLLVNGLAIGLCLE